MQTRVSISSSENSQGTVTAFFGQRPVFSAVLIFAAFVILSALFGMAAKTLLPQFQPEFIALIALSVLVALALSLLGWWKVTGFNLPAEWRDSRLMLVPFLIVLGLPFLIGFKTTDSGTFFYLAVA